MKGVLGLILAVALVPAFSLVASPEDVLSDGPQNWTAPPFWTPPAAESPGVTPGVRGSRAALVTATPLPFVGINPCRQYDSRSASPLLQDTPRAVPLIGAPCGIPAAAQAAALNITIFNITGAASNGVFRVGVTSPPATAWINYPSTETQRGNAGVVGLTVAGEIVVQVNQVAGFVDFVVDVYGYYAPQGIVNSLNTLGGDVTLSAGANVTITPSANSLTIAAAGGGPPSGAAGGSLSGSYPNPGIAVGAVGAAQLADLAVGGAKLANNTAVRSINGAAQDLVTIQGSGAVSVGTTGSVITIGAPSGSYVLGAAGDSTLIGAGYTEVGASSIEFWSATSVTGAVPAARYQHTAVWTGTEMIVWGGVDGSVIFKDGGRYNPATNSWTATSTGTNCPTGRVAHTAVWTGTEMIVWGGQSSSQSTTKDGGRYNPTSNTWAAMDTAFAPQARKLHTAVWTGTTMIVWGGQTNTGGIYTPSTNAWTVTSIGTNCPSARYLHTAVWTGSEMIVWGGYNVGALDTGARYNPSSNSWSTMATGPSARGGHTAVWTESEMIVWGGAGFDGPGSRYNPLSNTWSTMSTLGAPLGRDGHLAVWTGSKMIVWGGRADVTPFSSGGIYSPGGNDWVATTGVGAPSPRCFPAGVWTGSKMIVWGGAVTDYENTGGIYQFLSVYKKN